MTDQFDHMLYDAFDDFAATERSTVKQAPGTAAVRRTVAVQRRNRYTMLSLLGAVLIAIPVTAYAANWRGNNSPPLPGASGTATATASATPSESPSTVPPADVRNSTLTFPAFPGLAQACLGGGSRKFVNGVADLGTNANVKWTIGAVDPVMANVDGKPGDEELTTLTCQTDGSVHATQLVALTVGTDGSLGVLGYVINSPDAPNLIGDLGHPTVTDGVVQVTVSGVYQNDGWEPCDHQVRGYAYQNRAFVQVSGPRKFVLPSRDLSQLDFANVGLLVGLDDANGQGGHQYCVFMANGTGQAKIYPGGDDTKPLVTYTVTGGPARRQATSAGANVVEVLTFQAADGTSFQTVQFFQQGAADYPLGAEVLRTGTDGVTSIDDVQFSGSTLQISVHTSNGSHVWTYTMNPASGRWTKSNG